MKNVKINDPNASNSGEGGENDTVRSATGSRGMYLLPPNPVEEAMWEEVLKLEAELAKPRGLLGLLGYDTYVGCY